jgi:hypothetical protein
MAFDQTRALNIDESEAGMSIREIRARMQANEPPATAQEYLLRVRLEAEVSSEYDTIKAELADVEI